MNDGSISVHKPKSFVGIYPRPCFLMPHSLDLFCLYSNSELKQSFGLSSFKLLNHRKCHYELQTSFPSCGNFKLAINTNSSSVFQTNISCLLLFFATMSMIFLFLVSPVWEVASTCPALFLKLLTVVCLTSLLTSKTTPTRYKHTRPYNI